MTKFRHSSSFLISSVIYTLLIIVYISFLNTPTKPIKKKEQIVKIAIITPPAPQKVKPTPVVIPPKPIVPPKPKPKPTHKPKKKKKKKKKIIKKPKPKIKKKPKPKPKVKKKIKPKPKHRHRPRHRHRPKPTPTPEPIIEEVYQEPIIQEIIPIQEPIKKIKPKAVVKKTPPPPPPKVNLSAHKERFKERARASILANKKYPRIAKRRRIQGTVHVVFDIQRDGTVTNIHTSGASMILQKATKKSIKRSFPIAIPTVIIDEFPMRNVSINIDFILE